MKSSVFLCFINTFTRSKRFSLLLFFFQNGNMENPYCNGIEGILEAYHQSLRTVQLYGPTNFAPVVNHVARWDATTAGQHLQLFKSPNPKTELSSE